MKENLNQLWIARDKNGQLFVYRGKPVRTDRGFTDADLPVDVETFAFGDAYQDIPQDMYPEITFENSPQLLVPQKM
ncbi:MAG: hypothetical protein HUK06_01735 [Bacteroidaceae bacterium]|nr:hypothetical protein [Bacteroidaceae bacterium]